MVAVIVVAMRNSDRAFYAADRSADRAAHDSPDRTCRAIAFVDAFLRTADDSLGLRRQRRGKNDKRQ